MTPDPIRKADEAARKAVFKVTTGAPSLISGHVPSEVMSFVYAHAQQMAVEVLAPAGFAPPHVVISAETMDRRRFGEFWPFRDGLGLKDRVRLNIYHLGRPVAEVLRTVAHEQLHGWQHRSGHPGYKRSHNHEYRDAASAMGIPCDGWGHSCGITKSGPVHEYLVRHGIYDLSPLVDIKAKATSKSTLKKWTCQCGDNLWRGTADWPGGGRHLECGTNYQAALDDR